MATIWSDSFLQQLINDGEIEIVNKLQPIFERDSLAVTSGTATYAIPSYVIGLVQVTWKGNILNNITHIDARELDFKYRSNTGKPVGYIWNSDGYKTIRFFPVPNETIGADDTNIYGSDIENRVILSYKRSPDISQSTLQIPAYMGRRVIKPYVLWKAFRAEGIGQNLSAAEYHKRKYEFLVNRYMSIVNRYYSTRTFPPVPQHRMSFRRPELRHDITITP